MIRISGYIILLCLLSATIHVMAQSKENSHQGEHILPDTNFERYHFPLSDRCTDTVDVYSAAEMETAVSSGKIVRLLKDLKLEKTMLLRSDVTILGNGFKIIDNGIGLTNKGNYPYNITGRESFVSANGKIQGWSQTELFQGKWVEPADVNEPSRKLMLPKELRKLVIKASDNVYVTYGMWFVRRTDKVKSAKNGIMEIEFTGGVAYQPTKSFRQYTPEPYFYLSNYADNGIRVDKGKISWPVEMGEIRKCQLETLLKISSDAKVVIKDLFVVGGGDCSVRNEGDLKLDNCRFTNPVGGSIVSSGKVSISNCNFYDIRRNAVYVKNTGIADITRCLFKDIAHYGSNDFAVSADGNVYVGYCQFVDTNYGAIKVGMVNAESVADLHEYLIEYNVISYTPVWLEKRKYLGLWDSGAIYIATNNKKATIRYNRIRGVGGPGKNNAIFGDDGAYNMDIYGNIISGTENYYDIDCRYVSPQYTGRRLPQGKGELTVSTNNTIIYNIVDGFMRMEENKQPMVKNAGCLFSNNVIVGSNRNRKKQFADIIYTRDSRQTPLVEDVNGFFDAEGHYHSAIDYPVIPEQILNSR